MVSMRGAGRRVRISAPSVPRPLLLTATTLNLTSLANLQSLQLGAWNSQVTGALSRRRSVRTALSRHLELRPLVRSALDAPAENAVRQPQQRAPAIWHTPVRHGGLGILAIRQLAAFARRQWTHRRRTDAFCVRKPLPHQSSARIALSHRHSSDFR